MKTLFDEEVRYATTRHGTAWKLEGGKRYWSPNGRIWYCGGDDLNLFQRWVDSGAVKEVSSAMYH